MPDKAFSDTNVLLYAVTEADARSGRAEELLASGGIISVQVLNEFTSVARRKLMMPWSEVREALDVFRILCPSPLSVTLGMHEAALRIAKAHGHHIYDALVISAALEAGCTILYSEDLHDGQTMDGRLKIRNPFS